MNTVTYRVPDPTEVGLTDDEGWLIDPHGYRTDNAYPSRDEALIMTALENGLRHLVYIPTWTELGGTRDAASDYWWWGGPNAPEQTAAAYPLSSTEWEVVVDEVLCTGISEMDSRWTIAVLHIMGSRS